MNDERMCRRAAVRGCLVPGTEQAPALDRLARVGSFALGFAAVALVLCVNAAGARAAEVLCSIPDDLCTGNPCVTGDVEVGSPCVLNFGNRILTIGGKLRIPNGGVLELRARSIYVNQPILGRHVEKHQGDGASVTLIATDTVNVDRRIDVSASETPGKIVLAGTNVWVRGALRAKAKGDEATASGGQITALAARNLSTSGSGAVEVRGAAGTPGGIVAFGAGTGAVLRKAIDARGASGGTVFVNGGMGGIEIGHVIEVDGRKERGGSISMATSLDIRIQKKVGANGRTAGGSIAINGRSVSQSSPVRARSSTGPGGIISMIAVQAVTLNKEVSATGSEGGTIQIETGAGDVNVNGMIDVTGRRTNGGSLLIDSGDDLINNGILAADGNTAGGDIDMSAAGLVRLTKRAGVFAEGDAGGFVDILGSSANVETGADLEVDGVSVGGEVRLTATSGNLVLSGQFRARGSSGGVIEGMATGDVKADGDFQSRTAGCTGLSAGGSVDTTQGFFDGPVEDACN
jgi:hypothetical protein